MWYHSIDCIWFPIKCSIVTLSQSRLELLWDIRLQICHDLENRVSGPSRSLKMSPFDRAHMTFYWHSIVTMALSRIVSEIFNVENIATLKSRSRVNQNHSNHGPISFRFQDRRRFPSKIAKFSHPLVFCTPAEGVPFGIGYQRMRSKN